MFNSNYIYDVPDVYTDSLINALVLLDNDAFRGNIWDKEKLEGFLSVTDIANLISMRTEIKEQLYRECGGRCNYCHVFESDHKDFLLDHFIIKRKSRGFGHYAYYCKNLVLSCWPCNNKKGQKLFLKETNSELDLLTYEELPFKIFHPNVHPADEHFYKNMESFSTLSDEGYHFLDTFDFFNEARMRQLLSCLGERDLSQAEFQRLRDISSVSRFQKIW